MHVYMAGVEPGHEATHLLLYLAIMDKPSKCSFQQLMVLSEYDTRTPFTLSLLTPVCLDGNWCPFVETTYHDAGCLPALLWLGNDGRSPEHIILTSSYLHKADLQIAYQHLPIFSKLLCFPDTWSLDEGHECMAVSQK